MNINDKLPTDQPWAKPWPAENLELVGRCPVCGETSRTLLHEDLVDKVFYIAPGKWRLWACTKCSSAYIDPRPSVDSIGQAYINYYTHQEAPEKTEYKSLSLFRRFRRRLVNGYTNWRYGTCAVPSSALGVLALLAMPNVRQSIDREYRHLPRKHGRDSTLLDLGFGDGSFLRLARSCGWDVVGLDMDAVAVKNAETSGLNVHQGGVEYFDGKANLFDVITLSHVIEHVFNPTEVLKACNRLLKPNGQIWVETPNIESLGYKFFKRNWISLDSPRHLVLFNRKSLSLIFLNAGFPSPYDQARKSACSEIYGCSYAIQNGIPPFSSSKSPFSIKCYAKFATLVETFFPARREMLSVSAKKYKDDR